MTVIHGDSLDVLRGMEDNSIDAIVTDPPYGLTSQRPGGRSDATKGKVMGGFMGLKWDYDVPSVELWAECLRVLKPGGHLLAFAGTRTQHRMAVRIEDAGFEIRDMIMWVYGCLDERTQVATAEGVKPYHSTKVGDSVLCYNPENGEYSYQPILEIVEYDYCDTAYRLIGDFGEQVVSRNHRVIVERGGSEVFQFAETLEQQARVPVLEDLSALQQALHDAQQRAGGAKQGVQSSVRRSAGIRGELRGVGVGRARWSRRPVHRLRSIGVEAGVVAEARHGSHVQQTVQRQAARSNAKPVRAHGSAWLETGVGAGAGRAHDGRHESVVEGRSYLPEAQRFVRRSADKVRALSGGVAEHGAAGRLRDGASAAGGTGTVPAFEQGGGCASPQPRRHGQPAGKPDAVRDEQTAQGIRGWQGHNTAVVRVVPFQYTGKVWCLRVPTGAFVAVRDGVAFPTGNSGFPKSQDVSKAIDKRAGVERDVVGRGTKGMRVESTWGGQNAKGVFRPNADGYDITAPATPEAQQWAGWGSALKPALEPITVARKPLTGTLAANVLQWGTGGLNIDACRVGTDGGTTRSGQAPYAESGWRTGHDVVPLKAGRWPANVVHDGSAEIADGLGHAARFFAQLSDHPVNLFFERAKTIISAWRPSGLEASCCENANTAERSSSLSNEHVGSVLSAAAILASRGASVLSGLRVRSTIETESELSAISETLIATILSTENGYWPAQLHDVQTPNGCLVRCAETSEQTGTMTTTISLPRFDGSVAAVIFDITLSSMAAGEADSADRFKYCAKASRRERDAGLDDSRNHHATVKPIALMEWLIKLVTPPGGVVLDPFAGSGTTGCAAARLGVRSILVEREAEYVEIARRRVAYWSAELSPPPGDDV